MKVKLRIKRSLPDRFKKCKACVSPIEKANRDRGNKNALINLVLAAILFAVVLLLPPNEPVWFD